MIAKKLKERYNSFCGLQSWSSICTIYLKTISDEKRIIDHFYYF